VIWDVADKGALIVVATKTDESELPSWIFFNPMSYMMNGKAPEPQQQEVMITFTHPATHATTQMRFTIYVIPNNNPVT